MAPAVRYHNQAQDQPEERGKLGAYDEQKIDKTVKQERNHGAQSGEIYNGLETRIALTKVAEATADYQDRQKTEGHEAQQACFAQQLQVQVVHVEHAGRNSGNAIKVAKVSKSDADQRRADKKGRGDSPEQKSHRRGLIFLDPGSPDQPKEEHQRQGG